jgi:hypothetical protein
MIKTDGRPTIAWANPAYQPIPPKPPAPVIPPVAKLTDEEWLRADLVARGMDPASAHRTAYAVTHLDEIKKWANA